MGVLALVLFALADITLLISRSLFNEMLKLRNDAACPAKGFYTYDAFIVAANSSWRFWWVGYRLGWSICMGLLLSLRASNYNYGPAERAITHNLLNDPDAVARDADISFKTALWFWMTPQSPKPSSYDVITRKWRPSAQTWQLVKCLGTRSLPT
ncbi:hypothetical protein SLEP1_g31853 [Rubroshorea leprosula]|uniref:Glycoside hydrolase family 19 catalytic domain-containing protein n=1 Tax=Rubroshorea leprosula TaxID=152421 RepID=A0AAV5KBI0_9ROSI|nr:hypothetical protein SLEP1_g31853 [Rubroshorea leprosula]